MWKDIKGYEGIYQISDDGHVRRLRANGTSRVLKNRPSANYYTVCLSKGGVKKTVAVHRLVAETFLGVPDSYMEVNHKDGNKLNNDISNLEWVTQKENFIHAVDVLGISPFGKPPKAVKCIDTITGEVVAEYRSISDAARAIGKMSARAPISLVCQGYQPTAYGYRWEYI